MAAVSTTLALIAGGASLYNGYQQANAERDMGEYQRNQYNQNAAYTNQQAADATSRGNAEASKVQAGAAQTVGTQKAGYASQGVDVGVGSAANVQESTLGLAAADAAMIKTNAMKEAFGYKVQANNYTQQGKMAKQASETNANATLLTSGLKAFDYMKDIRFGKANSKDIEVPTTGTSSAGQSNTNFGSYNA